MTNESRRTRLFSGPWPLVLVLFIGSLLLFTRHNDFAFDYHPDEDGKTHQIIQRERNYHHPLLLLNATDLVAHVAGVPMKDQAVVVAGRWVSAAFAAGAVAALGLLGFMRGGVIAGLLVGVLVGTHAELYKAAHYLKEDTALMFGIAVFFVAAENFAQRPGLRALRWLGVAAAVAASGKYIGILTVLFALPLVWRAREVQGRWKQFALAFLLTFLVLNLPPARPANPFKSLKREVAGVTTGHRGLTRSIPHARYVSELRDAVPAPLLIVAAVAILAVCVTPRRRNGAEWAFILFPLVYFAILSCSPKTGGRYLLPVSTLVSALAGFGVWEISLLLRPRLLSSAVLLGAGLYLFVVQHLHLTATIHDFQQDDRIALAAWIKANVPADAIIAEDHRVNVLAKRESAGLPQRIFDNDFAADLGTLDEMRGWGTVYVAVSQRAYDRFFGDLKPRAAEQADFARRKEFYTRLFAEGELVFELKSQGIMYLQPGLKLYRLGEK